MNVIQTVRTKRKRRESEDSTEEQQQGTSGAGTSNAGVPLRQGGQGDMVDLFQLQMNTLRRYKTNRLEGAKNDLQKQVDATNAHIKGEDDQINQIQQAGAKVTADATRLRDEIKNLESTIEKCEDDKNTKDSQIRTPRDEIAHQEDMIVKLGKEKKATGEGRQKTEEV